MNLKNNRFWSFHSQNLKTTEKSKHLINWRFWLDLFPKNGDGRIKFHSQIVAPQKFSFGFDLGLGGDEQDIGGMLSFWFFAIYWHLDFIPKSGKGIWRWRCEWNKSYLPNKDRFLYPRQKRTFGIVWHSNQLWVDVWSREHEWRSGDPWYVKGLSFDPIQFLLGDTNYEENNHRYYFSWIRLPEKAYRCHITLYEASWTRARFGWPKTTLERANVNMIDIPPVPGKGENSWDVGDSAIHSLTAPAKSVVEAQTNTYETIMETRVKYGGLQSEWTDIKKIDTDWQSFKKVKKGLSKSQVQTTENKNG